MKQNDPNAKIPRTEKQCQEWANQFRLLVERDGRPIDEVKEVLIWSQGDSFWKGNILSATKLREKYAQLRLRMIEEQDKPKKTKELELEEFDGRQEEAKK